MLLGVFSNVAFTKHKTALTNHRARPMRVLYTGTASGKIVCAENGSILRCYRFDYRVHLQGGYRCSLPLNDTLGHLPRTKRTTKPRYDYQLLRSAHEPLARAAAVTANDRLVQKYHLLHANLRTSTAAPSD
jgi:hypothetical protein